MYLIGSSVDIHKIEKKDGVQQSLAGININTNYKIVAHSDGDIIIHAIIDSILGALGIGDIGEYFSDKELKYKNIDSKIMLNKILEIMNRFKFRIKNIDVTFISEHIILSPYKFQMRMNLRELLNCKNVSLKATRWEEDKMVVQVNCSLLLTTKI